MRKLDAFLKYIYNKGNRVGCVTLVAHLAGINISVCTLQQLQNDLSKKQGPSSAFCNTPVLFANNAQPTAETKLFVFD